MRARLSEWRKSTGQDLESSSCSEYQEGQESSQDFKEVPKPKRTRKRKVKSPEEIQRAKDIARGKKALRDKRHRLKMAKEVQKGEKVYDSWYERKNVFKKDQENWVEV